MIFQASSQLRKTCDRLREPVEYLTGKHHIWESAWEQGLLGKGPLTHVEEVSDTWKQAVCSSIVVFHALWYNGYYSIWVVVSVYNKKKRICTLIHLEFLV